MGAEMTHILPVSERLDLIFGFVMFLVKQKSPNDKSLLLWTCVTLFGQKLCGLISHIIEHFHRNPTLPAKSKSVGLTDRYFSNYNQSMRCVFLAPTWNKTAQVIEYSRYALYYECNTAVGFNKSTYFCVSSYSRCTRNDDKLQSLAVTKCPNCTYCPCCPCWLQTPSIHRLGSKIRRSRCINGVLALKLVTGIQLKSSTDWKPSNT